MCAIHVEGISTVADGTVLLGSLDQCSLFLLELVEDYKPRSTSCELAINLPMPDAEIQSGVRGTYRSVLLMCTKLRTLSGFALL